VCCLSFLFWIRCWGRQHCVSRFGRRFRVGEFQMKSMISRFLRSEEGFILSTEAVLVGTIMVLGLIVGITEVRNAVVQELGDYSQAVSWLSQDYAYTSTSSSNITIGLSTAGSQFSDSSDTQLGQATDAQGIVVTGASTGDAE